MLKVFLIFLAFIFCIVKPPFIFAQEKITNFAVNILAKQNGDLDVSEEITYDFGQDSRHGIFRHIPLVSQVGNLYRIIDIEVLDISVNDQDEKYSVNKNSENIEIKIGDPDKTITGVNKYKILYKVENGIGSNYETHDEIYWNVTGNGWAMPIEKASLKLETDFNIGVLELICFTGPTGSRERNCKVENNLAVSSGLAPYEGLTIVAKFPLNTFPKSTLQKNSPSVQKLINFLKIYALVWLLLNVTLAPYIIYWYFKNKSKKRFGSPSVNFDIPKNISPVEAGIIDNHKLEKNDVIAAIFDLAIKKYIKIEEEKKVKALMPDEMDYKISKLKEVTGLGDFEKTLMMKLFKEKNSIFLKDLAKDFYITFNLLERNAFQSLIEKKIYIKNPKSQMAALLVGGIFLIISGNLILGIALVFLSRKLNGRTQKGDEVDFAIDGLKIFLKSVSRYHKFQSKNLIAVEKYIPFAIALGLQDEFMQQLKIVNPEYNPSWYRGNNFLTTYPVMYSSFNSGVTTHAPSSSSGFSSGSSGGGGGGGGGGSW